MVIRNPVAVLAVSLAARTLALGAPIHRAAERGDLEAMKHLVAGGADVNAVSGTSTGWETPLMVAVRSKHAGPETLGFLLDAGADLEATSDNGRTALMTAAIYGTPSKLELLLERGADVHAKDEWGDTPLMIAAYCMYSDSSATERVRLLIDAGSRLEEADNDGRTALLLAAGAGDDKRITQLLHAGADLTKEDNDGHDAMWHALQSTHWDKNRALAKAIAEAAHDSASAKMLESKFGITSLMMASWDGNVPQVNRLLASNTSLDAVDRHGWSAIHWAVAASDDRAATIHRLVAAGVPVNQADVFKRTPLMYALWSRNEANTKALLAAKAETGTFDHKGLSPLIYAVQYADRRAVSQLLDAGANPNARAENGPTALTEASELRSEDALDKLRLLVEKGADVNLAGMNGITPLMKAVYSCDHRRVDFLLKAGAIVSAQDAVDRSALSWLGNIGCRDSAPGEQLRILKRLLQAGADFRAKEGKLGMTPLLQAAASGDLDIVRFLLDKGADLRVTDREGNSPLMLAARYDNPGVIAELIKRGANRDTHDQYGRTCLLVAAQHNHVAAIKALVANGAKVDGRDERGATALMVASRMGNTEAVEALVRLGAKIDAIDEDGETALFEGSGLGGHEDTLLALLEAGADPDTPAKAGTTPLMHAAQFGRPVLVQTLLDAGADTARQDCRGHSALWYAHSRFFSGPEKEPIIALLEAAERSKQEDGE